MGGRVVCARFSGAQGGRGLPLVFTIAMLAGEQQRVLVLRVFSESALLLLLLLLLLLRVEDRLFRGKPKSLVLSRTLARFPWLSHSTSEELLNFLILLCQQGLLDRIHEELVGASVQTCLSMCVCVYGGSLLEYTTVETWVVECLNG